MSELLDLDAVVAEDLEVKLGGRNWKLPGDAPSELLLRIIHLQQELFRAGTEAEEMGEVDAEQEAEVTNRLLGLRSQLTERLAELFSMRNEHADDCSSWDEEGECDCGLKLELSDVQIGTLIGWLIEQYGMAGDGDRPTKASTPRKPKSSKPSRPKSNGTAKPKRSRSLTSSPT